jgi:hypothetical protein
MDVEKLLADRRARDEFMRDHYASPLPDDDKATFDGLDYFDPDPAWRVPAVVEQAEPTRVPIPSTAGVDSDYTLVGWAVVEIGGSTYRLAVLDDGDGGRFVPFRDGTAGTETYEGGRYVGIQTTESGKAVIDFNEAHNPWCVYDDDFTCPLPPVGNRIVEPITAGERMYRLR